MCLLVYAQARGEQRASTQQPYHEGGECASPTQRPKAHVKAHFLACVLLHFSMMKLSGFVLLYSRQSQHGMVMTSSAYHVLLPCVSDISGM